ncbi:MAG TPA: CoA transferase [Acidimicrobiia bacterium]|nr:CoA transferase [Acidimicrobiia bacterium]
MTAGNDPAARRAAPDRAATAIPHRRSPDSTASDEGGAALGPARGADVDERAAWAASGAMFLTGRPGGPLLHAPGGFVTRLRAVGDVLARSSAELGQRVEVDVLALLGERAALAGLRRGGDVSCGGSARLLRTSDGWLAVNLPRPDDVDLLPAWLAGADLPSEPTRQLGMKAGPGTDLWAAVTAAVAAEAAAPLAERAQLLGLPVASLPQGPPTVPVVTGLLGGLPVVGARIGDGGRSRPGQPAGGDERGDARPAERLDGLLVADLSSLWAGPLCTRLLQQAGARVVKVESVHRPDGARFGPPAFFDLLHAGQEAVAVDFRHEQGRNDLRRLLEAADVVVEASRPRALEQLGIVARTILADAAGAGKGPRVWVSITGYGRAAPGRDRVAFGDDAAAAGGLVVWDETGPCFLADAVADPCAGIVAAAATLRALSAGGRWLLDVSMRDVAAHLAGRNSGAVAVPAPDGFVAEPPRARAPSGRGPRLGEHTDSVLAGVK